MEASSDEKKIHRSREVPTIGLGTSSLKGDVCVTAVHNALRAGYRMFDTALLYGNQVLKIFSSLNPPTPFLTLSSILSQREIGEAIRTSDVPREDIWITTKVGFFPDDSDKVWMFNPNNIKGHEEESLDLCLQQLGMDYVDLLLIHNPCTSAVEYGSATLPHFFEYFHHNQNSQLAIKPQILHTGENMRDLLQEVQHQHCRTKVDAELAYQKRKQMWLRLVELQRSGKCREIGVSNYPAELLQEMKTYGTDVLPLVNEVEFHPRYASPELLQACAEMNIKIIGYGLGVSLSLGAREGVVSRTIAEVAASRALSPLQVILKWAHQKGVIPITRSTSVSHLQENMETIQLPFKFSEEEMEKIDRCQESYPYYWDPASSRIVCQRAQLEGGR
jgi:diketogulonate reductase-like aldo/keto reductase